MNGFGKRYFRNRSSRNRSGSNTRAAIYRIQRFGKHLDVNEPKKKKTYHQDPRGLHVCASGTPSIRIWQVGQIHRRRFGGNYNSRASFGDVNRLSSGRRRPKHLFHGTSDIKWSVNFHSVTSLRRPETGPLTPGGITAGFLKYRSEPIHAGNVNKSHRLLPLSNTSSPEHVQTSVSGWSLPHEEFPLASGAKNGGCPQALRRRRSVSMPSTIRG